MNQKKWLLLSILMGSGPLFAHPLAPEAPCSEPQRPPRTDTVRWNAFVDAVDVYRACISKFAADEYSASEAHRFAAERATERWNTFVRDNLNVPADFPHQSDKPSAP